MEFNVVGSMILSLFQIVLYCVLGTIVESSVSHFIYLHEIS